MTLGGVDLISVDSIHIIFLKKPKNKHLIALWE